VKTVALLVHSNLLTSSAAASVAVTTTLLLRLSFDPVPLFIVFAAALFGYSFNRLTDREEDERNLPARAAFVDRYGKPLFAVGAVAYVAAIGLAAVWSLRGWPLLGLPAAAAALYSLGRAKRVLLVKNLIVGITWGGIPLGIGVYYGTGITPERLCLIGLVVVTLTVAAAIFDIKDIDGDRAAGIRTLPVVFGPRTTRWAAAGVTLALVPATVLAGIVFGERFFALLGFIAYVLAYIPFATPDRGPLFYGFVVDGEHVFLAVLVVLISFA
jgi:4-hydroxybenzoate polyprenyltransferase